MNTNISAYDYLFYLFTKVDNYHLKIYEKITVLLLYIAIQMRICT